MSRFVLSPRARDDLDGIWTYTARTWDVDQAERYLRRIAEAIDLVAETPTLGRNCNHIREGYRKHPVGSHVLFYRLISSKFLGRIKSLLCLSAALQARSSPMEKRCCSCSCGNPAGAYILGYAQYGRDADSKT